MKTIPGFLVVLLQYTLMAFAQDTCPVVRYTGSFKESDHVKDYALIGRSYRNLTTNTVQECFSVCINDCRCVSYQLSARRCELIDEDRHTAPGRFQEMPGYKYYHLKQQLIKANSVGSCSSQCNNGCCRYSPPCLNGGTCIELCQNVSHKFQCKCPKGFGGRVCEIPISCLAYSTRSIPSVYTIETSNGNRLNTYCDMTSEAGMVWTLIESFALSKREKYKTKSFVLNFPSNEGLLVNWTDYRLSLNSMQHVKRDATHWRATCNYNTDGLIKTDYIRGRLREMDILTYRGGHTCARVEYINVRGINCKNCTTHVKQAQWTHLFVDSGFGSGKGCQWNGRSGSVWVPFPYTSTRNWCENFGFYNVINPGHRCSSSNSSTTQWWLGAALIP